MPADVQSAATAFEASLLDLAETGWQIINSVLAFSWCCSCQLCGWSSSRSWPWWPSPRVLGRYVIGPVCCSAGSVWFRATATTKAAPLAVLLYFWKQYLNRYLSHNIMENEASKTADWSLPSQLPVLWITYSRRDCAAGYSVTAAVFLESQSWQLFFTTSLPAHRVIPCSLNHLWVYLSSVSCDTVSQKIRKASRVGTSRSRTRQEITTSGYNKRFNTTSSSDTWEWYITDNKLCKLCKVYAVQGIMNLLAAARMRFKLYPWRIRASPGKHAMQVSQL